MPERPLVLFAAPTVADKERRYGGAPKYYFPSHSRQVSRLTPQFNVLQNTMNSGSIHVWKCIFQKKQILWHIIFFN